AQNATSCYSLTVVNDSTGRCQSKQAAIRADNTCFCVTANTSGVVNVPARLAAGVIGVPVDIGIGHPCDPIDRLAYQFSVRFDGGDQLDPHKLSLNGLPPGEPVFGTLDVGPQSRSNVSVAVSYPEGHDLGAPYSVVFYADTDGDGLMEEMCSVPVASSSDSVAVTDAPRPGEQLEVARLQAAPNPFFGGSTIAFTTPRAGMVELGVYDVNGRQVRLLQRGLVTAGTHTLEWDGRDLQGHRAPAGVYFVRLDTAQIQLRAKLTKLR
ncbi:MAG: FlgD immunoglobulin-like domain containing protein, partial [Candidatus Eisenbacteria bacterium]